MNGFQVKKLLDPAALALMAGILLGLIGLIVYSLTGVDDFNETLSAPVLIFSIVAIALSFLVLGLRAFSIDRFFRGTFDILPFIAYLVGLIGLIYFVGSKINYLTNVMVSIDGTTISAAFVLTAVSLLLSAIAFLLAGIFSQKEAREKKGGVEDESEHI